MFNRRKFVFTGRGDTERKSVTPRQHVRRSNLQLHTKELLLPNPFPSHTPAVPRSSLNRGSFTSETAVYGTITSRAIKLVKEKVLREKNPRNRGPMHHCYPANRKHGQFYRFADKSTKYRSSVARHKFVPKW